MTYDIRARINSIPYLRKLAHFETEDDALIDEMMQFGPDCDEDFDDEDMKLVGEQDDDEIDDDFSDFDLMVVPPRIREEIPNIDMPTGIMIDVIREENGFAPTFCDVSDDLMNLYLKPN